MTVETLMKELPDKDSSDFVDWLVKGRIHDWETNRSQSDLYGEGASLLRDGNYEEALRLFNKILERNRNDFYAWFCKGVSFLVLGRFEDALDSFEEATRLKPDYVEAWVVKGGVLFFLEKYEKAVESFDKVIEIGDEFGKASGWCLKGFALLGMDRAEEASVNFENAFPIAQNMEPVLEENPYNVSLYRVLAVVIVFKGMEHIASANMEDAEKWAHDFNFLKRKAKSSGIAQSLEEKMREIRERVSGEELELLNEFEDMVRLEAIENPLERWKVLGEMIRQKWPKGVSAVDAIREQRE